MAFQSPEIRLFLTDILRTDFGFDGFVVSDWNSVIEMIDHGYAAIKNMPLNSCASRFGYGDDFHGIRNSFTRVDSRGKIQESQLDFYVANILRIKFQLDLFNRPFIPSDHPGTFYDPIHLNKSKEAAIEGSVLLKNNGVLPLLSDRKILLTGPLANKGREQLGPGLLTEKPTRPLHPRKHWMMQFLSKVFSYSRDNNERQFQDVLTAAQTVDVIVFVGGEEAILSGEAHSRANIKLPGAQEELLRQLSKLDKKIVLVIVAGRPINITNYIDEIDAVLMMWHPGTMGGPALKDMLFGASEPSGRYLSAGQKPPDNYRIITIIPTPADLRLQEIYLPLMTFLWGHGKAVLATNRII